MKRKQAAFRAALATILGRQYLRDHPDFISTWWRVGAVGGMFRAGVRYGRKHPK